MDVDRSTGGQPLSVQIVRAVAAADDADPSELAPLGTVVDAAALERLFRGRDPGSVTFGYEGYAVTVRSDEVDVGRSSPISDRGSIEDDGEPARAVESFDAASEPAALAVVAAVGAASETATTDFRPLYSVVDPDALDDLLTPSGSTSSERPVSVSFVYHSYPVTVDETGVVTVRRSRSVEERSPRTTEQPLPGRE